MSEFRVLAFAFKPSCCFESGMDMAIDCHRLLERLPKVGSESRASDFAVKNGHPCWLNELYPESDQIMLNCKSNNPMACFYRVKAWDSSRSNMV